MSSFGLANLVPFVAPVKRKQLGLVAYTAIRRIGAKWTSTCLSTSSLVVEAHLSLEAANKH